MGSMPSIVAMRFARIRRASRAADRVLASCRWGSCRAGLSGESPEARFHQHDGRRSPGCEETHES